MTVSTQLTKRIYSGNGLTREWSVDFPVSSLQDIRIFITSPQGVQSEVESNYEFDETSHILTYPTLDSEMEPLATGWLITLVRRTPLTQEIDLLRQGELDAEVLEQGYDKLTYLIQELSERVDRCMKYPVSAQSLTEAQTELTAAQVDALNSGATREQMASIGSPFNVDIAQIETNKENITALQTALATKQDAGDYATNTSLSSGLATKQDAIGDLATIRSGASAGATAVQPGDLTSLADINLSNLTDNGKILGSGLGMPSETYDTLTLGTSGTTYTAPANGYYYVDTISYDGNPAFFVLINNTKSFTVQNQVYSSYGSIILLMPVTKNDSIEIQYGNIGTTAFRFIYAEGSESEAN